MRFFVDNNLGDRSPMTTDLTERGLERLICKALPGDPCDPPSGRTVGEPGAQQVELLRISH